MKMTPTVTEIQTLDLDRTNIRTSKDHAWNEDKKLGQVR